MSSRPSATVATYRALVRQWHETKNRDLLPGDVAASSRRRVWWRCPVAPDHLWPAQVAQRTYERTGCPFCPNRRLSKTNCLAGRYPALAREWHPTRNGRLRPDDIAGKARQKVWWRCSRNGDHEWQETPAKRALHFERLGQTFLPACYWLTPIEDSL